MGLPFIPRITLACARCGKDFQPRPTRVNTSKYCSRFCHNTPPGVLQNCETCGKEFRAVLSATTGAKKHCSRACRTFRTTKPCEYCGKEFTCKRSHLERRRFCSMSCRGKALNPKTLADPNETHRTCKQCGERKPLIKFGPSRKSIGGRYARCRGCMVSKEYKKQLDEAYRARQIAKDPEAYRAKMNQRSREWSRNHPERRRATGQRMRAQRMQAEGSWTAAEFAALCEAFGNACVRCGSQTKLHADHVVPLARGGDNYITNIQPLCQPCNNRKFVTPVDYRLPWKVAVSLPLLSKLLPEGHRGCFCSKPRC